eukprot:gb/GECG01013212.1/.p1 GENE.gb/GECG01013212.1/~~gb/GECG01013212.1/.p1  ORF type:complete len:190 (+),score=10.86 gb/GECG01013212.1/:1-570(+)
MNFLRLRDRIICVSVLATAYWDVNSIIVRTSVIEAPVTLAQFSLRKQWSATVEKPGWNHQCHVKRSCLHVLTPVQKFGPVDIRSSLATNAILGSALLVLLPQAKPVLGNILLSKMFRAMFSMSHVASFVESRYLVVSTLVRTYATQVHVNLPLIDIWMKPFLAAIGVERSESTVLIHATKCVTPRLNAR